jgi:hypothetical protein
VSANDAEVEPEASQTGCVEQSWRSVYDLRMMWVPLNENEDKLSEAGLYYC